MKRKEREQYRVPWGRIVAVLCAMAGIGGGLYALVRSIDPGTLKLLLGFLMGLLAIVVVGVLYAGKDLVQAYLVRRQERQDQLQETAQLAQWTRLMQSGANRVNLQMPGLGNAPAMLPPGEFSGAYRDTTLVNGKVEIE